MGISLLMSHSNTNEKNKTNLPRFIAWDGEGSFDHSMDDKQIEKYLQNLFDHNIKALFLKASNDFYIRTAPIAQKVGIQLHAWRPTMIRADKEFMMQNKDWYAVNRNNESCVDKPPYVDYYRWFCPSEPKVLEYVMNNYLELAMIDGLSGIHFDYIRYCDIYLPIGLLPQYNFVQDHEMPEFDFCYCTRCRGGFEKEFGRDPIMLDEPANDLDWREWRLKKIVTIVNTITKEVKKKSNKLVTAAVFPTPKMSVEMVRQDWGNFEIDAVFPMLYNGFYNENIDWIGNCVSEGISTMKFKKDLHAGVFLDDLNKPELLKNAIDTALENGANGVVFFAANNFSKEQLDIIINYE